MSGRVNVGRGIADKDSVFWGTWGLLAGFTAKYVYNMVYPDTHLRMLPPEVAIMKDKLQTIQEDQAKWFQSVEGRMTGLEFTVRAIEAGMSKKK